MPLRACTLVLLALLTGAHGAFAAKTRSGEAHRYDSCMDQARHKPEAARAAAEAWLAEGGGTPAAHCRAVALLGLGRPRDAAIGLQTLGDDPTSTTAPLRAALLRQAASAWMLAGAPDRALGVLTDALKLAPGDVGLLIDRSVALANLGRDWDAIDDLNAAIDTDPDRFEALLLRATAYRRLGVWQLAQTDITRALAISPKNSEALLENGNIMRLAGRMSDAAESWRQVIRLAPDSAAAHAADVNLRRLKPPPQ